MKYYYFILVGARYGAPPFFLADEQGGPARYSTAEAATAAAEGSYSVRGGFGYLVVEASNSGQLHGVDR